MNKKVFLWGITLFLLATLFLAVGTALANPPISGANECGKSGPVIGPNGLLVKKDVFCEMSKLWSWQIFKSADQSSVTLAAGQVINVNYTVVANAVASTEDYFVKGNISFQNTHPTNPLLIESVSDSLGLEIVTCPVNFPYTLVAGFTLNCTYETSLDEAAPSNSTTVVDGDGIAVTAVAPIDWSKAAATEVDECAEITDTFAGPLGTVCAGAQTSFTFNYPRTVGPFMTCGLYKVDNTANFTTTDSNATGSSSWSVDVNVPCASGCSLTPGYWKTHSSFGPAPYDDTWALLGENAPFFSSGKTYYQVLWTPPSGGNVYYILAHAYIAAELNQLNGADFSAAQSAFDAATALFSNPTNTPATVGALKGAAKNQWTKLATILDNYNNGLIGPGHCSE